MRFIHTSDWHLGKYLEGRSRIEEQIKFCDDFVKIVEEENADIVLIAGDVYDTSNPPANAEMLFYDTITKIADNGKRCVFVIAGNHDNPERLEAVNSLAQKNGIIILGYPLSKATLGIYPGFEISEAKEGFTKIKVNSTGEIVNIISLPYPSEKRLNDSFSDFDYDESLQKTYSEKVGEIFEKLEENYKDDEINIAVSHIFVVGSEISDSERRIELGGSLLVDKKNLPKKSQYTALGHIHKPQVASKSLTSYYSGSPIQYSKNERNTSKSVKVVDIVAGKPAEIKDRYLDNYKQICLFKCDSIDEALKICEERADEDMFAFFEIYTDDTIEPEKIREMKRLMKDILEIKPISKSNIEFIGNEVIEISKANIADYFNDFFKVQNSGMEPSEEVMNLFKRLISSDMEVSDNEAN